VRLCVWGWRRSRGVSWRTISAFHRTEALLRPHGPDSEFQPNPVTAESLGRARSVLTLRLTSHNEEADSELLLLWLSVFGYFRDGTA